MKTATKTNGSKKTTKAKAAAKAKAPKPATEAKPKAAKKDRPLSALDAAAIVLKDAGEPMACRAMVDQMKAKKLWTSDAPTPHATLYSAIIREIGKKKDASRFKKTDRGQFALNA
jgi:hypothetical protein